MQEFALGNERTMLQMQKDGLYSRRVLRLDLIGHGVMSRPP